MYYASSWNENDPRLKQQTLVNLLMLQGLTVLFDNGNSSSLLPHPLYANPNTMQRIVFPSRRAIAAFLKILVSEFELGSLSQRHWAKDPSVSMLANGVLGRFLCYTLQQAELEARTGFKLLMNVLLSTGAANTLRKLNPFLNPKSVGTVISLTGASLLAGSRMGHLSRCLALAYDLRVLLQELRSNGCADCERDLVEWHSS